MKKIHIIGGGTFSDVRNHLSICMRAFGDTAKTLNYYFNRDISDMNKDYKVVLHLTKMADSSSNLVTNEDVSNLVEKLVADKDTKCIVFNASLVDFNGTIDDIPSSKYAERLSSNNDYVMKLHPADKIIAKIRKERKDIFLVAFKTTCNATEEEQYHKGLKLMKKNSVNLVLCNDTYTRNNMIIVPEEAKYCVTTNRDDVLQYLTKMTLSRMENTFTRSTVVNGEAIKWNSDLIPDNLKTVVNYCIDNGAYKPFLDKTVGHFAVKLNDTEILTSIRKSNFNHLKDTGLVKVTAKDDNEVIAYGFKPSVGGQSQRIIFKEHPDLDCIVHFHCPLKEEYKNEISTREQWRNECGSHECGKNTSDGLKLVKSNNSHIFVVYLDHHGPNIVFSKTTPAQDVIAIIDKYFDLKDKTGGLFQS